MLCKAKYLDAYFNSVHQSAGSHSLKVLNPKLSEIGTTETHMAGGSFQIWLSYSSVNSASGNIPSMTMAAVVAFQTEVSAWLLIEDIIKTNLKQPSWRHNLSLAIASQALVKLMESHLFGLMLVTHSTATFSEKKTSMAMIDKTL